MTQWRAVVPIKLGADTKSRLAGLLSPDERCALGERMARHVLDALEASGLFDQITILSPDRPIWWTGDWTLDRGRGLNAELTAWRAEQVTGPVLIIHADLPLLMTEEVAVFLVTTESSGIALATDRAGTGSNALAIADGRDFAFRFGTDSRARHVAQARKMPVLASTGLAADLDTPDDAIFVEARGFALRASCRWEGPRKGYAVHA